MLRYFTTFVLLFAYMNFCEVDKLFPFIDIKKLRMRPAKKFGQSCNLQVREPPCSSILILMLIYISSQFGQPLTSNHLNSPQTLILD